MWYKIYDKSYIDDVHVSDIDEPPIQVNEGRDKNKDIKRIEKKLSISVGDTVEIVSLENTRKHFYCPDRAIGFVGRVRQIDDDDALHVVDYVYGF